MNRVPSLDGLRTWSVAFVLFGHMAGRAGVPRIVGLYARFGVEVFFVISGFIITRLLLQERAQSGSISLWSFYQRRFFRIVPAAYVYLAISVAVHFGSLRLRDVLSAMIFFANCDFDKPSLIRHLWSLGIEEQFYILWPLVLVFFFRRRVTILALALCAAPFIWFACRQYLPGRFLEFSLPANYDSLALGCLGACRYDRLDVLRSRWFLLCGPAALAFHGGFWNIPGLGAGHTLWPLAHLCIAAFVIHTTYRRYFFLNATPMVWLGTISYGLYLWQELFVLSKYPALAPLATVAAATASYYVLERPILRWSKRSRATEPTRFENRSLMKLSGPSS